VPVVVPVPSKPFFGKQVAYLKKLFIKNNDLADRQKIGASDCKERRQCRTVLLQNDYELGDCGAGK
jgi:hypothetical protein